MFLVKSAISWFAMGKAGSKKPMREFSTAELLEMAVCESLEHQALKRSLKKGCRGIEYISSQTLQKALEPLENELRALDAEGFLRLDRVSHGAKLCDGVSVKAIHDEIYPPESDAIRYLKISETELYSIGVFIFPPNVTMPIHDHPGMVVYSRLLYGDLQRVRLDLTPDDSPSSQNSHCNTNNPKSREAYLHPMDRLEAPDLTALFPYEGNLHQFVSGSHGAAVLDVLIPPYNSSDDRDCSYYEILAPRNFTSGPCRVAPCPMDEAFICLNGSYSKWKLNA